MSSGMIEHIFHETGRLWPVADAHGAVVLFNSKDTADLYAAEHDATVGTPMPTTAGRRALERRVHDPGRRRRNV